MKYDPIMCMMVDDSVKTKDVNKNEGFKIHKAEVRGDKLYLTYTDLLEGVKETESFTKNEAKGFIKDPWNTWEGNTKSVMMKFVKDNNTIDHAIRSCDSREDDIADELFDALQQIGKRNINKNEAEFISEKFFDGKVSVDELMRIFNKYKKEYL